MKIVRTLSEGTAYVVQNTERDRLLVARRVTCSMARAERVIVRARKLVAIPGVLAPLRLAVYAGGLFSFREWTEGTSLSDRLASATVAEREQWFVEVLKLVSALHARGWAHGRLHPGNVILDSRDKPVLVDLAITAFSPLVPEEGSVRQCDLCLAPEQVRGASPTRRSDVFALGVMAYILSRQAPPFPTTDRTGYLHRMLTSDLPTRDVAGISPGFGALIRRCTLRPAWKRPAHAGRALALFRKPPPLERARVPLKLPHLSRPVGRGLAMLSVLVLVSFVVVHLARLGRGPSRGLAWKVKGDLACAGRHPRECLQAYTTAVSLDPSIGEDSALLDRVLALMDDPSLRLELVRLIGHLPSRVEPRLLENTGKEDYDLRWNSIYALQARGAGNRIDYVPVYGLDLLHGDRCEIRRRAAEQLAELGDRRAVPYLMQAMKRSAVSARERRCMRGKIDYAMVTLSNGKG